MATASSPRPAAWSRTSSRRRPPTRARCWACGTTQTAIGNAASVGSLLAEVHPAEAVRDRADEVTQEVHRLITELGLDRDLFAVLDAVDPAGLDEDARRVLDHTLRDFRRAGVDRA